MGRPQQSRHHFPYLPAENRRILCVAWQRQDADQGFLGGSRSHTRNRFRCRAIALKGYVQSSRMRSRTVSRNADNRNVAVWVIGARGLTLEQSRGPIFLVLTLLNGSSCLVSSPCSRIRNSSLKAIPA